MGFLYKSHHRCPLPKAKGRKAHKLAGSIWVCDGWRGCGQHYRAHIWKTVAQDKLRWHRITGAQARKVTNELEARSKRLPKL